MQTDVPSNAHTGQPLPALDDEALADLARQLAAAGVRAPDGAPLRPATTPTVAVIGRVGDIEPLFVTDLALAAEAGERLLRGLIALALLHGSPRAVLAIREDLWGPLAPLRRRCAQLELLRFAARHPLAARSLLCDLFEHPGFARDANELDAMVVFDATTLVDVGAGLDGDGAADRVVSVVGAVSHPAVVRVRIGTPLGELVAARGCADYGRVLYHNGALGGRRADPSDEVTRATRGVLVLPHRHPLVLEETTPATDWPARCAAACVHCRACTEVCPAALEGAPLQPHLLARTAACGELDPQTSRAVMLGALECLGCRVCDLCCPARVAPGALVRLAAERLAEQGVVLDRPTPLRPAPERAQRRLPLALAATQAGLAGFAPPAPTIVELPRAPTASTVLEQILRPPHGGRR